MNQEIPFAQILDSGQVAPGVEQGVELLLPRCAWFRRGRYAKLVTKARDGSAGLAAEEPADHRNTRPCLNKAAQKMLVAPLSFDQLAAT